MCPIYSALCVGMGKARDVLQGSHERGTKRLEEERTTLKRSLSSKQVKLQAAEEQKDTLEKKVHICTTYIASFPVPRPAFHR